MSWTTALEHNNTVESVAWSPAGDVLASGSDDHTIKLWKTTTWTLLRTLIGHSNHVLCVAWSPTGVLASGSVDETIKLWNHSTGKELRTLTEHKCPVLSVAWSPAGDVLASGSWDKTIRLWNRATGKVIRTLTDPAPWGRSSDVWRVSAVAWRPTGDVLAIASEDSTIWLWNTKTDKVSNRLTDIGNEPVYSIAWSPAGNVLASACRRGSGQCFIVCISLWNTISGSLIRTLDWRSSIVLSLAFSPTENVLASVSGDRVYIYNLGNVTELVPAQKAREFSTRAVDADDQYTKALKEMLPPLTAKDWYELFIYVFIWKKERKISAELDYYDVIRLITFEAKNNYKWFSFLGIDVARMIVKYSLRLTSRFRVLNF